MNERIEAIEAATLLMNNARTKAYQVGNNTGAIILLHAIDHLAKEMKDMVAE